MRLKTLIIDDEPIALEKLKKYVGQIASLELTGACADGLEALAFLTENKVDLIIADINMPDLNGIELVRSLSDKPMIIFTTAYAEYAVEGFKVAAIDYLLKPYGFADFSTAINKAISFYNLHFKDTAAISPASEDSIFVKIDHRFLRIGLSEILFIKGYGEYLQIHVDGKLSPVLTLSSFAAIKEKLSSNFLQVHRSYIVNMNRIDIIDRNRIIINGNVEIPVGEVYKSVFQDYLALHTLGKKSK